jgi:hypothetical protein
MLLEWVRQLVRNNEIILTGDRFSLNMNEKSSGKRRIFSADKG